MMNKYALIFGVLLLFSCKQETTKTVLEVPIEDFKTIVLEDFDETLEFYSWAPDRVPLVSAHRGGPYPGYPENSIEAFEHVLRHTPAILEFDVALTKDSVLVLMHDNTLDRTTTGKGKVIDHTYQEIQELFLVDKEGTITDFKVPTLDEVLS